MTRTMLTSTLVLLLSSALAFAQFRTVTVEKNLDNPAQQVFQKLLRCNTTQAGSTACQTTFTVPAGKVLVLEYLKFDSTENGSTTVVYNLGTTAGGEHDDYSYTPGTRFYNFVTSEHLVRIYADPGSTVTFSGVEDNAATGFVQLKAVLSGHLVNVP